MSPLGRRRPRDAKGAFDRLVDEHLEPALRTHGFRRAGPRGLTFHRAAGPNLEVVHLQKALGSGVRELSFTVDLAVGWAALRHGELTWADGQRPSHDRCHLRARLGTVDRGEDIWWTMTRSTRLERLSGKVMDVLQESGLPWLEGRSTPAEVAALLSSDAVVAALPLHDLYPLARIARLLDDEALITRVDEELRGRTADADG